MKFSISTSIRDVPEVRAEMQSAVEQIAVMREALEKIADNGWGNVLGGELRGHDANSMQRIARDALAKVPGASPPKP